MKKILVILPAYNEEENIGQLLVKLKNYEKKDLYDILVIDDGSKDRTAEIVKEKGVQVLSQVFNMGYGAALQTAYKYAKNNGYELLLHFFAVFAYYRVLNAHDAPLFRGKEAPHRAASDDKPCVHHRHGSGKVFCGAHRVCGGTSPLRA